MTNITKTLTLTCLLTLATGTVALAETKAYGYLFGSKTGNHSFVSFDIDKPQTLTTEGNRDYGYIFPSAGEYVDGKIYTYRVSEGDFYELISDSWAVYDGETFKRLEDKKMYDMNRAVDMTYDYTTNTMYALIEDRYTTGVLSETSLYAIDLETGDYTLIGSPGVLKAIDGNNRETEDALITLACDNNGQLYAMSAYRYLYKVDKFTGNVEQAAPQHKLGTSAQFQSMTFDTDGKLWWAQQHPSYGHFCEIDLNTGIPGGFEDFRTDYEKLNKLGDDAQVTCLFFKNKSVRPNSIKAVTELKAEVDGNNVNTVKLSWTLPTSDYSDNDASATAIKIYRIGISEAIATLSGETTTYTDNSAPNGDTTYEVITVNESGNGFPAFTSVFAGYDQLEAVGDITLHVNDRTATVTWTTPTATVNGGYSDYDAISYNVYRSSNGIIADVAKGLEKTEFSETIGEDGGFYYIIEPCSGGVVGKQAISESFVLSTPATIPYFTGFEDDGDGPQWTIKNHPNNNAGWFIGVASYCYDGKKTAVGKTSGSTNTVDDWLISPPIKFDAGDYTIDFYGNGASYDTHSYGIYLGSDPNSPESFTQELHSADNEYVYEKDGENTSGKKEGWAHYEKSFKVDNEGVYHIGIHNRTKTTYANLRLDNLSIKKISTVGLITPGADTKVTITPTGGNIEIAASCGIEEASIINMAGCTVVKINGDGCNAIIQGSKMVRGIYIVTVRLENGSTVYKKITF